MSLATFSGVATTKSGQSVRTTTFANANFDSDKYRAFRPGYQKHLYDIIYDYHTSHDGQFDNVLDLATGTGMVAKELARKFKHVYATDQSEKMLQAAEKLPNIQYAQGVAEEIEFEDGSMDMITMGQAFHWVDHERFFREAKRVVKRDGTIAIIGYAFVMIDGHPEATKRIQHLGTVTLKRYWESGRDILDNLYRDITLPFPPPDVEYYFSPHGTDRDHRGVTTTLPLMHETTTLSRLYHYIHTWSSSANWRSQHGKEDIVDPVDACLDAIAKDLGVEGGIGSPAWNEKTIEVTWPVVLLLIRNSEPECSY